MKEQTEPVVRNRTWVERFALSEHAQYRASQRGLQLADVYFVLRHGKQYRAANAVIYYLRRIDIPADQRKSQERLEGTAIITASKQANVITVWRNRQKGMRNIRRKLNQFWYREQVLIEECV